MRRLAIAASVAALTLIGGQATATTYLRYDFIAETSVDGLFQGSFTGFLTAAPTVTTDIAILPLCQTTVGGDSMPCWNARLRPDGGPSATPPENYSEVSERDEVELWWIPPGITSDECYGTFGLCQTYAYLFPSGAFGAPGRYLSDPGNPDQMGVLRVSLATSTDASFTDVGSVPEPGAWSLLIAGFATVGAALRNRRRFARA